MEDQCILLMLEPACNIMYVGIGFALAPSCIVSVMRVPYKSTRLFSHMYAHAMNYEMWIGFVGVQQIVGWTFAFKWQL
jgi:hypothetical protein